MEKLKLPEVLKKLKGEGIDITKRTFEYYQRMGLLPKPEKQVGVKGRGVYGYYDYDLVLKILTFIRKNQEKGLTLAEILKEARKRVVRIYKSVFHREFSGIYFHELSIGNEEMSKHPRPVIELLSKVYEPHDELSESKILSDLPWWHPEKGIELRALKHIGEMANESIRGLLIAEHPIYWEIQKELHKTKGIVSDAYIVLARVLTQIKQKIWKAGIVVSTANVQAAEISDGEWKDKTTQEWQSIVTECKQGLEKEEIDGEKVFYM